MGVAVLLFNRDLRLDDHPALTAASASHAVVPLFVLDPAVLRRAAPNRTRFLLECIADLRRSLRTLGGDLVVRRGDTVKEAMAVVHATGAEALVASADVSHLAQRRQVALGAACAAAGVEFQLFPGVTVVPPGELRPSGGGAHFRVFTPYWRRWSSTAWRDVCAPPARIAPPGVDPGGVPVLGELTRRPCSPDVVTGGEREAQHRLEEWLAVPPTGVWETSRLSPYFRFGCLSPLDAAVQVLTSGTQPAEEFVRQLCWRDFFHQVTADFPAITSADYRPRPGRAWRQDPEAFAAWAEGRTGVPLVDAGMRQLKHQGWMPNRARLVAASYLAKTLELDWRLGAAHFSAWLVDGDLACNFGNWQWVAGTGNDTRPNRVLNPIAQARRFDPDGAYVSAWATA